MRYQIYEAKSVKYDAQQRVGVIVRNPDPLQCNGSGFLNFDVSGGIFNR